MNCSCRISQPVPLCAQSILIGYIDEANLDITLVLVNKTIDTKVIIPTTSGYSGEVTLDLESYNLSTSYFYEVYILNSQNEIIPIWSGEYEINNCIGFEVEKVNGETTVFELKPLKT